MLPFVRKNSSMHARERINVTKTILSLRINGDINYLYNKRSCMQRKAIIWQIFKRVALVFLGIAVGFIVLVVLDRTIGTALKTSDYFVATNPNTSVTYDTNEFTVTATTSAQG